MVVIAYCLSLTLSLSSSLCNLLFPFVISFLITDIAKLRLVSVRGLVRTQVGMQGLVSFKPNRAGVNLDSLLDLPKHLQ
jgi:hypothetical protein